MQLNEILEENSVKTISQKTKISESNLEAIFAKNFEHLQKTKALGFIAIIEREYDADLSAMREEALEYYSNHQENNSYSTAHYYLDEEKKGKSKLLIILVLAMLIYASWYFFTQYDKKNLSALIPFIDEKTIDNLIKSDDVSEVSAAEDLSIAKVTVSESVDPDSKEKDEESASTNVAALVAGLVDESSETEAITQVDSISIIPVKKLWFGVVDMETKEREHFSIEKPYALDISKKSWLVATSSAPFTLQDGETKQEFSDAKEHYFKIDKNGIEVLSKSEYTQQGGWHQW